MSLFTAIKLKEALDRAPTLLDSIGTHVTKEEEFKRGEDDDCEEEEEEEECKKRKKSELEVDPEEMTTAIAKQVYTMLEQQSVSYSARIYNNIDFNDIMKSLQFDIKINNNNNDLSLSFIGTDDNNDDVKIGELVKKLWENAPVSGFGDVATTSTKVDLSVRNARELIYGEHFSFDEKTLTSIQARAKECWIQSNMYPREVKVVPYKMVIYGPGGKFGEHKDTPATNLVGSFLIGFYDNSGWSYSHSRLIVTDHNDDRHTWVANPGLWCCFFPDLKHEVTEMKATDGYRMAMAFKVEVENCNDKEAVDELIKKEKHESEEQHKAKIKQLLTGKENFGILLSHQYSRELQPSALKGDDYRLYSILEECKDEIELQLLPVMVKFSGVVYDHDGREVETNETEVLLLTDHNIKFLLKEPGFGVQDIIVTDADDNLDDIKFFSIAGKSDGCEWMKETEASAEHTGNEARPYSEDSLYIYAALLVLQKEKEEEESEVKKQKV